MKMNNICYYLIIFLLIAQGRQFQTPYVPFLVVRLLMLLIKFCKQKLRALFFKIWRRASGMLSHALLRGILSCICYLPAVHATLQNKVHFLISSRLSVDHMPPLLRLLLDFCLVEEH